MKYLKSLGELVGLTYVSSFLGLAAANGFNILDTSAVKAAAASALPAAVAVLYGAVVKRLGNLNSAVAVDTRDDA